MQISYLSDISWLSALLLIGVLLSIFAIKMNISNLLLLLVVGALLGQTGLVSFDQAFLTSFGIFALVMIVFDSTTKFKIREISKLSPFAFRLAMVFFVINAVGLTFFTHLFFSHPLRWTTASIMISALFGIMMSGTSPSTILTMLKEKREDIVKILEFESIVNTPLIVIIPLFIISWYFGEIATGELFLSFIRGVMAGVGTGFVIGIVLSKIMKKRYFPSLSPIAIIALALVSYTLAENIGGNGVLSVTTLGVVFGWAILKEKEKMEEFIGIFTNFLTIVIFILLGLFIKIPTNIAFLLKSILLFGLFIVLRYFAVRIVSRKTKLKLREKLFMTFSISKGIGEAVVAFILLSKLVAPGLLPYPEIENLKTILNLSFLFIFYSIIMSSVTIRFSDFFLKYAKPNPLQKA